MESSSCPRMAKSITYLGTAPKPGRKFSCIC
uniref:Uncharacterized protein n=1 Tax=Macrostomum lignano TaxID=282301 RepID=A0A1I8H1K6_9PLAT